MLNTGNGYFGSQGPKGTISRALLVVVPKYVNPESGPIKGKVPAKRHDYQSSHQTNKYHQYAVGTSQVPSCPLHDEPAPGLLG